MPFFKSASVRVRSARFAALAAVTLAAAAAAGCGSETMSASQASSYLVINVLEAASCAEDAVFSPYFQSDVQTGGSICEDAGRVRMSAAMKDVTNPVGPSDNNALTLNRYRVVFRRSDGRNTPGVDVPYAFDGAVTFTVVPGNQVTVPFVLVRVQSKLESPLVNLGLRPQDDGPPAFPLPGAGVISTLADVTFYGRDQTGREVAVTGTLGVNFADWADPD